MNCLKNFREPSVVNPIVRVLAYGLFVSLSACGGDSPATPDASAPLDAPIDAPYVPLDGGPTGAALLPVDACDDLVDTLYATPAGLPAFDASLRGTLLGCASVETITAAQLATRLEGVPGLVFSGGDVRVYVIAYRTEREPRGVGGVGTALVYLPDVASSERVPLVVISHGMLGVADECAPSRFMRDSADPTLLPKAYLDGLFLSFAARGLPVVAPDYAGLGTDGTHGFMNWFDPARSAADGARALRALLPAERLDGGTILYGHSQGGGVSLTMAALAAETPDLDFRAIVAAAPGYRMALTTPSAGYVPPTTFGELMDRDFVAAVVACQDTGACDGLPGAFVTRDAANEPHLSAASPPLLIVGSSADEVATPGLVGCVVSRVRTDGASPETCMVSTGDHLGMVSGTNAYSIEWALATAAGGARPPCPGSSTRPRCSLF